MLISSVWRGGSRKYFILGLLIGGLVTATVALLCGALLFHWWIPKQIAAWAGIAICGVAVARDAGLLSFRLPQNARQVPELVASYGPRQGALQFGVEMGTGARTFMTSMLPFVPLSFLILEAPWSVAVLCGVAFGIGRGTVPVVRAIHENDLSWSDRFATRERAIQVTLDIVVLGSLIAVATWS